MSLPKEVVTPCFLGGGTPTKQGQQRTRPFLGCGAASWPPLPAMRTLPYPTPGGLRKAQAWQRRPRPPATRRRIAIHEAGHIVLMQWVGLVPPLATIYESGHGMGGAAHWPEPEFFSQLPDPQDETGELAATAAAVYHAGVMAEMIAFGIPWEGPVHYSTETDYQRADDMLRERFGRHASGPHAYAQQVALHVLATSWADVEIVATELVATGRWSPFQPSPHADA